MKFFQLLLILLTLPPVMQAQTVPGPTDANAFTDLNRARNDLNIEIPMVDKQISELGMSIGDLAITQKEIQRLKSDNTFFLAQIDKLKSSNGPDSLISSYQYSVNYNNNRLVELNADLDKEKSMETQRDSLIKVAKDKKFKLIQTENQIAQLMIPKISQQNFMFWSSIAFVILMGFLLGTFFYVVSRDIVIRQTIFGTDSGIQFITLFSIVIAIIIFGLTGILEGKELSALLGSVAGYILGKAKLSVPQNNNPQNPPNPPQANA